MRRIQIRMSEEHFEKVAEIAKQQHRPVKHQIECLIEEAIREAEIKSTGVDRV